MNDDSEKPDICCLMCRFYEARSQFCRKDPPVPVAVPDSYGAHLMSAFPKISCPNFDYCSHFQQAQNNMLNG